MCRSLSFISIVYQKNGGVENKKTCGIGGGKNSPVQYNVSAFNSPFAIPTSQTPFSMSSSLSMQESEKNASGVWKKKIKKETKHTSSSAQKANKMLWWQVWRIVYIRDRQQIGRGLMVKIRERGIILRRKIETHKGDLQFASWSNVLGQNREQAPTQKEK